MVSHALEKAKCHVFGITHDFLSSLLGQHRYFAAGVGLGTAYSLRYKKGIIPMVAAGAIGTSADMLYGVFVECANFRKDDGESQQ